MAFRRGCPHSENEVAHGSISTIRPKPGLRLAPKNRGPGHPRPAKGSYPSSPRFARARARGRTDRASPQPAAPLRSVDQKVEMLATQRLAMSPLRPAEVSGPNPGMASRGSLPASDTDWAPGRAPAATAVTGPGTRGPSCRRLHHGRPVGPRPALPSCPPLATTIATMPARIAGGRSGHAATRVARSGSTAAGAAFGAESLVCAPLFAPLSAGPSVFP